MAECWDISLCGFIRLVSPVSVTELLQEMLTLFHSIWCPPVQEYGSVNLFIQIVHTYREDWSQNNHCMIEGQESNFRIPFVSVSLVHVFILPFSELPTQFFTSALTICRQLTIAKVMIGRNAY